jgi:hypothetical protein
VHHVPQSVSLAVDPTQSVEPHPTREALPGSVPPSCAVTEATPVCRECNVFWKEFSRDRNEVGSGDEQHFSS